VRLNELPGARSLRGRMNQARVVALLVTLTFVSGLPLPARSAATRARESVRASLTIRGDSTMAFQDGWIGGQSETQAQV